MNAISTNAKYLARPVSRALFSFRSEPASEDRKRAKRERITSQQHWIEICSRISDTECATPDVLLVDRRIIVQASDGDYVMHIPEQLAAIGQPLQYFAWMIPGTWRE